MKIVLKDGGEYELRRINKLIVDSVETSEYKNYITDKSVTTCEVTLLSLVPTEGVVPDLFKIKTDFSVDNISQVTYVTEKDESAVDTYKSIGKISQNMTDYVNDITVTLLKY